MSPVSASFRRREVQSRLPKKLKAEAGQRLVVTGGLLRHQLLGLLFSSGTAEG